MTTRLRTTQKNSPDATTTALLRLAEQGKTSVEAACELMIGWPKLARLAAEAGVTFSDLAVDDTAAPEATRSPVAVPEQATGQPPANTPGCAPSAAQAHPEQAARRAARDARYADHTYTTTDMNGTPVRMVARACHGATTDLPARRYLEPDEEIALAAAWKDRRDGEAARRITEGLRPFIDSLLAKARLTGHGRLAPDIEQHLLLGILEELDGFDPAKGVRLITYLYARLHNRYFGYLMDNSLATRVGTNKDDKKIWYRLSRLRTAWEVRHGRPLSHAGRHWLAKKLNVPVASVERMERRLQGDISLGEDEEDRLGDRAGDHQKLNRELADALVDPADTPEAASDRRRRETLGRQLMTVPRTEIERVLLAERIAPDDKPASQAKIARRFHLSRKRVATIERRLHARLRAAVPAELISEDVLQPA